MSDLAIKGTLTEVLPAISGTSKAGKAWNKQDFVINTKDQFPKDVCFTLFGDKTSLINNLKIGDVLEVKFNLESRKYKDKYFHNVNCWAIRVDEESQVSYGNDNNKGTNEQPPEDENDTLPF